MTVVYGELPRLLLSTVGSPWIVKFGLVWVFRMPFNFVVVGVLTDSARLEPSNYAKTPLSVLYLVWLSSCRGTKGAWVSSSPGTEDTANLDS